MPTFLFPKDFFSHPTRQRAILSVMEKLLRKIFKNDILTHKEDLYPYAFDTSPNSNELIIPRYVVFPQSAEQISELVKLCTKHNIAIIPRGAGTCHCGGCRSTRDSIVVHLSRMNKILEIDKNNLIARVQPNVVLGDLQKEVEKLGLFFPPDPSNLAVSTIGGAVALCAGGPRTFKYGSTKDYVVNLEVVTPEGKIMKTSCDIAKTVTGYNLTQLFVGSEGTLGIITEITLKLIPKPEKRFLTLAYFDTMQDAANAVNRIISALLTPSVIDLLDKNTLATIEKFNPCGLLTNKAAALLIEIDGFKESILYEQKRLKEVLQGAEIIQASTDEENETIWKARRSAFACVTKLKPNVITEDVVVPRTNIPKLVEKIEILCKEHNIIVCIMGHAGDGNIHPNFALDLGNEQEAKNFKLVKDKLFKIAIELGGTLSGEHGIGCEKRKYLKDALDPIAIEYMGRIKRLFDPHNILNPNKMF